MPTDQNSLHPTTPPEKGRPELFAFCIDTHDALKRNLADQASLLQELGYRGVGHLWLDQLADRVSSLDARQLRLFQVTLLADIGPGQTPFDSRLRESLPLLKGRGVQLAVLMQGGKPSDPAGDERAVQLLRELAALAQPAGVEIVLYPHTDFWLEKVEDADRVAAKVARPNVNVMFNLCHWLRVSPGRDYASLFRKVMPRLRAVSINGADTFDPKPGWGRYIQPLGRGSFDVATFLGVLLQEGYQGPIGLQCYGIPGDAREHLRESMTAWRRYLKELSRL